MRKLIKIITLCASASWLMPVFASDDKDCDKALVQQTTVVNESLQTFYAWLQMITKETYDEAKHHAEGQGYFFMFSGSYDDFTKARSIYLSKEGVVQTLTQLREVYKSYLTPEQLTAWVNCKNGKLEIAAYVQDISETGATLKIEWNPPAGDAIGPVTIDSVDVEEGRAPSGLAKGEILRVGDNPFVLRRPRKFAAFRMTIKGYTGITKHGVGAVVYVTPFVDVAGVPEPQREFTTQTNNVMRSFAYFDDHTKHAGPWDCIKPPEGIDFIVAKTHEHFLGMSDSQQLGACVPPGQGYCDGLGEDCSDIVVDDGCFVSSAWHRWYKNKVASAGVLYSASAACAQASHGTPKGLMLGAPDVPITWHPEPAKP